VRPPIFSMG